MRLETIQQPTHNSTKCPSCGGNVQRRVYGEMHAGAQILNGERVEISRTPDAGYADPIWLDEITQYFDGGLFRLWPAEHYFARGGKSLHRAVWASAFGLIPAKHHIHHKDGNPRNNSLYNLELLPAAEHLALSSKNRQKPEGGWFSEKARQSAADWHGSEEGRLWHKRQAERTKSWTKWKRVPANCLGCGEEYQKLLRKNGREQKYCSNNCKARHYRQKRAEANGNSSGVVPDSP